MNKHRKKSGLILTLMIIIVILVVLSVAYDSYKNKVVSLLDKTAYKEFCEELETASQDGELGDQESLREFVTSWADDNNLKYTVDGAGNIIFRRSASALRKKVSPTIVCVSYNYETAASNVRLLASAAMIAASDMDAGRHTVIFFNDERSEALGYNHIDRKYFKSAPDVIYLDYGASAYMSSSSFAEEFSSIMIKGSKRKTKCDTAVRVHIEGIRPGEIMTDAERYPDPVSAFSTLLTRLKSKSTICELADFSIGSDGNMYPVSLDAEIILNSYSVASFTSYIDKQIRDWEKTYQDDYGDIVYTYEVIDDQDELPDKVYTPKTFNMLTNVLYTVKNGVYKYEENDNIPDGRKAGDNCGINYTTDVRASGDNIFVDIMSQAYSDEYLERIMSDNNFAADILGCEVLTRKKIPAFLNGSGTLPSELMNTYNNVNDVSNLNDVLRTESDNYFTPCSLLAGINSKADVVHLRLNPDRAVILTNTILCYISTKGNILL